MKKHKTLGFIIALLMCFNVFTFMNVEATEANHTVVMLNSVYEESKGKYVTINVYVSNPSNMASGIMELEYDPAFIEAKDVGKGELLSSAKLVENLKDAKNGKIKIAWATEEGISENGVLFTIKFRTLQAVQAAPIKISYLSMYDDSYNEISSRKVDGRIGAFKGGTKNPITVNNVKKDFKINFSLPVDKNTINNQSITVIDSKGKAIAVDFSFENGNKTVVVSPKLEYIKGKYTLTVTEQILSQGGKQLRFPAKVDFEIK